MLVCVWVWLSAVCRSDESIYGWIKSEPETVTKPPRYVSSHDPTAPVSTTLRVVKKPAGTMGRKVKDTITPAEFVKKGTGTAALTSECAPGVLGFA